MAISHTEKIEELFILTNNADNIVAKVRIYITSVDDTNSQSFTTEDLISINTNKGADFISYESLKESDVLGWITTERNQIKAVNESILNVQSATTQKNLPW